MARRRKSFAFRFHEILRYSQDDKVFGLRPKRKPIRSVLINGMRIFGVSVRKANAEISAEQNGCTSDCAVLLRSWRTKRGGIMSARYLSMRVPPVFPASDG